jgi:hypothetical protein
MITDVTISSRDMLRKAWAHWPDHSQERINAIAFLQKAPRIAIENVMKFTLEEPLGIARPDLEKLQTTSGSKILGFFDRRERRVVVIRDTREDIRRFTTAHELAHIALHPDLLLHRDRAIAGCESPCTRPTVEREADAWAADFLMPERMIKREFQERYGDCIDGRDLGPATAYAAFGLQFSEARQTIEPLEFVNKGPRYRAFLAATAISFHGNAFMPLAAAFGVSPSAIGIRLCNLKLVL